MRDVFSSLPAALSSLAENEVAREAIVFAAWDRAVGTGVSEQTAPVRLDGKVLTVAASSETWKKQVTDLAGQILFKLNGELGSSVVAYIDFTVDSRFVRKQSRGSSVNRDNAWKALVKNEITPELERAADEIEDDRLRELFLSAAAGSLARRAFELKDREASLDQIDQNGS